MSPSRILTIAALAGAAVLAPVAANATANATAPAARAVEAAGHPAAAHRSAPRPVLVVRAGRRVGLGHGAWMTLTRTERCAGYGTGSSCKSVVDGNQAPGSVGLQTFGDSARTLYSPLYIGPGKAARMVVGTDGGTYRARVVTLAGHPGYATGYAWGAPVSGGPPARVHVVVYDAAGRVLARL